MKIEKDRTMTTPQGTGVKPDLTPRHLHVATNLNEWARAWNASSGVSERLGLLHDIFGTDGNSISEEAVQILIGIVESKEGPDMPFWGVIRMKAVTILVRRVLKPAVAEKSFPEDVRFLRDHPELVFRFISLFAGPLRLNLDGRLPWRDDVVSFLKWCDTRMRWFDDSLAQVIKDCRKLLFKAMLRFCANDAIRSAVLAPIGSDVWIRDAKTDLVALRDIVIEGIQDWDKQDWLKGGLLGVGPCYKDEIRLAAATAYANLKGIYDAVVVTA